jgi:DNA adenine methylase
LKFTYNLCTQFKEFQMIDSLPPLLKWPGGKRWLVPTLARLYDPYRDRTYVSLFVGGGADVFGLAPARAILNDINPHLMNFYRWCKAACRYTIPR